MVSTDGYRIGAAMANMLPEWDNSHPLVTKLTSDDWLALGEVVHERIRQVADLGYTQEHDATHTPVEWVAQLRYVLEHTAVAAQTHAAGMADALADYGEYVVRLAALALAAHAAMTAQQQLVDADDDGCLYCMHGQKTKEPRPTGDNVEAPPAGGREGHAHN